MEQTRFFSHRSKLAAFLPPYLKFSTITNTWQPQCRPPRGCALVWWLADAAEQKEEFEYIYNRAPGLSLIIVLPPAEAVEKTVPLIHYLDALNPIGVLPHGRIVAPHRIKNLLALPPRNLASAAVGYLSRRRVLVDSNLRREIGRLFELAPEVHSVSQLARRLYTSRRTLGRRFDNSGLPVPSHWLQFARLFHLSTKLQAEATSMYRLAVRYGYPDGFTMSNQMKRMIGCRPTEVRRHLGWEWLIEQWLAYESRHGALCHERFEHIAVEYPTAVGKHHER